MIRRIWKFIALLVYFTCEVVKANLQVARLVFVSNHKLKPAILAIPLTAQKDYQILILSSMITLTPGTLSLDVSADKSKLFVHVIHTDDVESTIEEIKTGFEKWVLEVFV